jgi:putative PIN family toxin of toxin-antitoxin system
MRLVVDTNVLVSALLKAGSVPARALEAIFAGTTVLQDPRVLAEYRTVFDKPKFKTIDRGRIAALIARFRDEGVAFDRIGAWEGEAHDPDDRIFVELAIEGRADAIVTGNIKDFPTDLGFEVLPPATLLARLEAR